MIIIKNAIFNNNKIFINRDYLFEHNLNFLIFFNHLNLKYKIYLVLI